jgi:hypothetical protein
MEEPTPNIPLLRKAVEWVEEQAALGDLSRWYQGDWALDVTSGDVEVWDAQGGWRTMNPACGTVYCVAGYIAALDGYTEEDLLGGGSLNPRTQESVMADDHARKALGLSYQQSWLLFAGHNTAADVRRIAENIAGERL